LNLCEVIIAEVEAATGDVVTYMSIANKEFGNKNKYQINQP
tara:strand:+ start:334 stop:456 length:123 start_codon:yes stop_codon:yes gene_type:complete